MDKNLNLILNNLSKNDANEAQTRYELIDHILNDILSWPRSMTSVEEYIDPGYADYVLNKPNGGHLFFIEAKKVGNIFTLPIPHKSSELSCYIKIKNLMTDKNTSLAMKQVRDYCMDIGCEYGAITNGNEWIIFKCFEKNKRWDQLNAFVIRDVSFFEHDQTEAKNKFSYIAITEHASLSNTLASSSQKDRPTFVIKDRITSYSHPINANYLAMTLRPIITNNFGVIKDNQIELMDRCYVSEKGFTHTFDGMRSIIQDSLTPYFEEHGVKELDNNGKGGSIGGRITKNIKNAKGGEVLTLFGGKGAGKSTFIRRLLKHTPPKWLKDNSVSIIIDLLKVPADKSKINDKIWQWVVNDLDKEGILSSSRSNILNELFKDKFEIAAIQRLAGLEKDSPLYNDILNLLVEDWKKDLEYCAISLAQRWNSKGKGVIIVIDNTDQYSGEIQDYCFTAAQEISDKLSCIVLISMREERFYNSKIHGVLDAFQNSGFHLSSPKPSTVFLKRLAYTIELLRDPKRRERITNESSVCLIEKCCTYLQIIHDDIKKSNSPLNNFLTACGHGDIRLTLDLFRSFLLSGYTNVQEMLDAKRWVFQIHQVIKPVMVPTRYFYDESKSGVLNIFQARDTRHSSHFTSLRILRRLVKNIGSGTSEFVTMAELRTYFVETFNMVEDFNICTDILLKYSLIESNNRIDYFDKDIDQVRITSYGVYMLQNLSCIFTYLDLICTDCNYFNEQVCNNIISLANKEYSLFSQDKRHDRVLVRLNRVEMFLKYLAEEESRENIQYGLFIPKGESFSEKILLMFDEEKIKIKLSLEKQSF